MHKQRYQNKEQGRDAALPARITAIKPQKKLKDRFSLYQDDHFITGVSVDTLMKFDLKKGVEITPLLFDKIRAEEEKSSIKNYLIQLLARRDHSRHELNSKAVQKGYRPEYVTLILNDLEQNGYINNSEFARKFASDKFSLKKWGPVKIRFELIKKGIDKQIIDRVLLKETEDLELNKICVDLILKRKRHFLRENDSYKRKQKIASYLQGRGFSFDTINRVLPDIIDRLNV